MPVLIPVSAKADVWWQMQFAEGESTSFYITVDNLVFDYAKAWYGDPNNDACGADVSDIVTNIVANQTTFSISFSNSTFGDPCPGIYKTTKLALFLKQTNIVVPTPEPTIQPTVDPTPEPTITPTSIPTAQPYETPGIIEPTEEPTVEPTPTTTPTPTISPTQEPTPTPTETKKPSPEPTKIQFEPISIPKQTTTPEPIAPSPTPEPIVTPIPLPDISKIDPTTLTAEEVQQIVSAANETLNNSEPGSTEYQQALTALFIAAKADDIKLDPALAAVPLIGPAAQGITDAINFVGNVGADMSPKAREAAKKQVVVSVVAVGAAVQAVAGATMVSATTIRKVK